MSTLKVSNIQSPSTTDGGLAISATGAVSGALPVPNRNLLYNGAMQVAQRGTSATGITGSGLNTADRWYQVTSSLGTWTQSVDSDAPSASGFAQSLKMLCTTADASPAGADQCRIEQRLEGQDLQRIAKGTASAQQLTLSFWVKSNVTGTFIVYLLDSDNAREVSAAYTVTSAGVWEQKSVTFPADTTGTLDNDNAQSMVVSFFLGAGTNFTSGTLNTSWNAGNAANRAPGQTNLAAAVNNYWQITGVQLETGPVATEFEHRSFGDELARCQRYYYRATSTSIYGRICSGCVTSSTGTEGYLTLPVTMRGVPSALEVSNVYVVRPGINVYAVSSSSFVNPSPHVVGVSLVSSALGATNGDYVGVCGDVTGVGYIGVSAEL